MHWQLFWMPLRTSGTASTRHHGRILGAIAFGRRGYKNGTTLEAEAGVLVRSPQAVAMMHTTELLERDNPTGSGCVSRAALRTILV